VSVPVTDHGHDEAPPPRPPPRASEAPRGTIAREVTEPLRRRLAPLVALLAALLATGAPLAHHVVGARELQSRCGELAGRAAEDVAHEAQERPRLWRYDSIKILAHLQGYRAHPDVAGMQVFDAYGPAAGSAPEARAVLYCQRELRVGGHPVGAVWVAMDLAPLRRVTLALLGVFALLAAALGSLVYAVAMRAARSAAGRIEALVADVDRSRAALQALNEGLEQDVRARTEELERAYAALRATAARAVTLQENERRAIGRDLHDSVGQALTAIRIHAQLAGEIAGDPAVQRSVLARVTQTTDAALEELRRALARLGPAVLDEVGLEVALVREADAFLERTGCELHREIDVPAGLEPAVEVAVYRIAQEALTNVTRHARASEVWITLEATERALMLVIEDDGAGPQGAGADAGPDAEGARVTRGVHGMRERAELLGGTLRMTARAPRGTRVEVVIPRNG
jgi:signal transduction histidine kinase